MPLPPGSRRHSARAVVSTGAGSSPSVHRQDPPLRGRTPGHACRRGRAVAAPATLGTIRLEQLEHPVVVAAGLAGEVPADRCAGSGGRRRARRRRRRTPGRAPMPIVHGPTPGHERQLRAACRGRRGPPTQSRRRRRGPRPRGCGPAYLDAERVEPPGRHGCEALRGWRREQARGTVPGPAARPAGEQHPLAHRLAGGDPLGDHRGEQDVVEVAARSRRRAPVSVDGEGHPAGARQASHLNLRSLIAVIAGTRFGRVRRPGPARRPHRTPPLLHAGGGSPVRRREHRPAPSVGPSQRAVFRPARYHPRLRRRPRRIGRQPADGGRGDGDRGQRRGPSSAACRSSAPGRRRAGEATATCRALPRGRPDGVPSEGLRRRRRPCEG